MGLGGILVIAALVLSLFIFGFLIFKSAGTFGVLHSILVCILFIECWVFMIFAAGVQGTRVKFTKLAFQNEQKLKAADESTKQLRWGDYNDQNLNAYVPARSELRRLTTDRGRVWRSVMYQAKQGENFSLSLASADAVDENAFAEDPAAGAAAPATVESLPVDLVVYGFSERDDNDLGQPLPQTYLGEFKVISAQAESVELEPATPLSPAQLAETQGPWTLYELMPADSHQAFANEGSGRTNEEIFGHMDEAAISELLAGIADPDRKTAAIERYTRDGTAARDDDPVDNIWVQVEMLKNFETGVDNTGDTADASRGYFDPDGKSIDARLKRGAEDGSVKLTTEMRDQMIILNEPEAQKLIAAGNAQLVQRFYVRSLTDYRQAFSNLGIKMQDVTQRIQLYTRELTEVGNTNQLGQQMLADEQTVNSRLSQDSTGFTKEVAALESAVTVAEADLAKLKSNISTLFNSVQRSGGL